MKVADAIRAGEAMGLARLDSQLLLLHALGRAQHDRGWLLAHDADALPDAVEAHFLMACRRRHGGEPLAYIVGTKEFFGLELAVDSHVLVPRPDTETLVEWALEFLSPTSGRLAQVNPRVVDLGTGSGAIALAIKSHVPAAHVEAVDASEPALRVARANASRLGLDVAFRRASWLDDASVYDLIVSNPPYIADNDAHLDALQHEPQQALRSGTDGLDDIREIVRQAPSHLKPGGWLLLEHGWDQAARVRGLLSGAGLHHVQSRRDLGGIERCSGAQRIELG